MADIVTPEQRRRNMQHIKGKDTAPELFVRKLLYHEGYRYRLYTKEIPGHPDIWLKKYNIAIFIHGCFWHRHEGCKYAYTPKTRVDFWTNKFKKNVERDKRIKERLTETGVRTIVIWECTVRRIEKSFVDKELFLKRIRIFINNHEQSLEI